jgi:hypothetical protein
MAIPLYQKSKWNSIYSDLLKSGTERRHSALDYKTIEEFWKQKNNFKNVVTNTAAFIYLHINYL